MKRIIWILVLSSLIFIAWCSPKGEENTQKQVTEVSWYILDFLEKTIEEKESCSKEKQTKTFVSYALLWTDINSKWNLEYYLVTSWKWMYIDKRWNIYSSCGFGSIPTTIEIATSETGFSVVNYLRAKDWNLYTSSTKEMFSAQAYKKWLKEDFKYNTDLSPLQRAEKYFWITFFTGWDFACTFCDQKRYNSGYADEERLKEWTQEGYEIFTTIPNNNKYMIFYNNWDFERNKWRDEWTGIRIFGKNDETILIDSHPPHSYDRYIIQYLSEDTMHVTREIMNK